jgi:hypothetical protein
MEMDEELERLRKFVTVREKTTDLPAKLEIRVGESVISGLLLLIAVVSYVSNDAELGRIPTTLQLYVS